MIELNFVEMRCSVCGKVFTLTWLKDVCKLKYFVQASEVENFAASNGNIIMMIICKLFCNYKDI
jgi:hypothetical protein